MMNTGHKIDPGKLRTELEKIDGVTLPDGEISLPVSIEVDGTRYGIDAEGESYVETWYYTDDNKITNGTTTIELGDTINYDATNGGTLSDDEYFYKSEVGKNGNSNQTFTVSAASGLTWKVLGVEKGQILIMPTTNLATGGKNNNGYFYLGTASSSDFTNSQNAYVNAVNELDSISAIYGHGEGADGARSVKVEDVDNIMTGFDKTTYGAGGYVNGYGNEETYSCEEEGKTNYSWDKNGTLLTGTYNSPFTYYTGSDWKTLGVGESVTLTSNYYYYSASSYKATSPKANDNVYSLLFDGTDDDQYYWLGSSFVGTYSGYARFGVRCVVDSRVSGSILFNSNGYAGDYDCGVRPAVYLNSDINLTPNETNAWDIS